MSSYEQIKGLKVEPNEVRDYFQTYVIAANAQYDLWREASVIGLDMIVHNRGAAALTVSIDLTAVITIDAGDTFAMSDIKFSNVNIVTAVAADVVLAGVKRVPEQVRRNLKGVL